MEVEFCTKSQLADRRQHLVVQGPDGGLYSQHLACGLDQHEAAKRGDVVGNSRDPDRLLPCCREAISK